MSKHNPNLACPMISRSGFEPYESPVGERSRIITSRKERERDMQEHNCVDTGDVKKKEQVKNAQR